MPRWWWFLAGARRRSRRRSRRRHRDGGGFLSGYNCVVFTKILLQCVLLKTTSDEMEDKIFDDDDSLKVVLVERWTEKR